MLEPKAETVKTGVGYIDDALSEVDEHTLPWPDFTKMAEVKSETHLPIPQELSHQESISPSEELYELFYQEYLSTIPYYRRIKPNTSELIEQAKVYSLITVVTEHCLRLTGIPISDTREYCNYFMTLICDFDRPGLIVTYYRNKNFEALAEVIASVVIRNRISTIFPNHLFGTYCRIVFESEDPSILDNPALPGDVEIVNPLLIPTFGENLASISNRLLSTIEVVPGTFLTGTSLYELSKARKVQLIDKKGWIIPKPSPDMRERLPLIKRQYSDNLDIDITDLSERTSHYSFSFNAIATEGRRPVETVYPGVARFIEITNSVKLDEKPVVNGTNPILETLGSIQFSPFDRQGQGPHIDMDIRQLINSNPELLVEVLSGQGYEVTVDTLHEFLNQCGIRIEQKPYQSTSEIVASAVEKQIMGDQPVHDVLSKFIAKLQNQEPFYLLERLTPPLLQYRNIGESEGEHISESATSLPAIMMMMLEMAIDSFDKGVDLWLIQCDNAFTRQLKMFFGEDSFYTFTNEEGEGIMQIKRNVKDPTKVKEDRCNTMALDIVKVFKWLLSHDADQPYYQLGEYVLGRVSDKVREHLLQQLAIPVQIETTTPIPILAE